MRMKTGIHEGGPCPHTPSFPQSYAQGGDAAYQQLAERLVHEVATMLAEGDRDYLRSLSRTALGEVIENEVRFLGLYAYENHEAPVVIHTLVEHHLDQWRAQYVSTDPYPCPPATGGGGGG
jgi:hypothetical protein